MSILSLLENCGFNWNFAKAVEKNLKACNVMDYFMEITRIPSYADMRSELWVTPVKFVEGTGKLN